MRNQYLLHIEDPLYYQGEEPAPPERASKGHFEILVASSLEGDFLAAFVETDPLQGGRPVEYDAQLIEEDHCHKH